MWLSGRLKRSYGALVLLSAFRDSCVKGQLRVLNALLTCRQEHERWLRVVMGGVGVEEGGKEGTIHVKLGLTYLKISQYVCLK